MWIREKRRAGTVYKNPLKGVRNKLIPYLQLNSVDLYTLCVTPAQPCIHVEHLLESLLLLTAGAAHNCLHM